jgi:SAM-dependent methyltransferase
MSETENDFVRQNVRARYAGVAKSMSGCCGGNNSGCCSSNPKESEKVGYSAQEVNAVPDGANMGLGCGNPQLIASLKTGETVVDLGSGGGFDSFLASKKVGASGRVIGVDMTPDMISKARRNAEKGGFDNVEFRLGEIENLPVADNSVDVIMSNCVINLSPDKQRVFHEAYRILRKNGRLAISDVLAIAQMPDSLKKDNDSLCSCISGATKKEEIEKMLLLAGFINIAVTLKPESREFIRDWAPGSGAERFVCSADITGYKN